MPALDCQGKAGSVPVERLLWIFEVLDGCACPIYPSRQPILDLAWILGEVFTASSARNVQCLSMSNAHQKITDWRVCCHEAQARNGIGYNIPTAVHYPDGLASTSS